MSIKTIFLVLVLTTSAFLCFGLAWAAPPELPNTKTIRQELEVMRSILQTTSGFVAQELSDSSRLRRLGGGESSISSLYLAGQGAIFLIDFPENALGLNSDFIEYAALEDIAEEAAEFSRQAREEMRVEREVQEKAKEETKLAKKQAEMDLAAMLAEKRKIEEKLRKGETDESVVTPVPAPGVAPVPPAPPAVVARPPRVAVAGKNTRKQIEEKQKARQLRADEWDKRLAAELREVLVKHGDSLSIVKSSEYISFVLIRSGNYLRYLGEDNSTSRHIITIQKNQLLDYKKGILSLENLNAKIVEYTL